MAAIRILLVDDECLVRKVLRQILATYPDVEVVGEAAAGDEAISSVERLQPHVVIMDIRMPRMDGIAAAREISQRFSHVKIIGLTEYAYGYHADAMEKAGAAGVYQKSKATEELYAAIKKIGGQDSPMVWA
jgi:DNA-binding NarL/FixJ family response regulator